MQDTEAGFQLQDEAHSATESSGKADTSPSPPRWSYVVLAVAVLAMSTGGIWFALLGAYGTPPLMMACWRLALTALLQLFGVAYELYTVDLDATVFWPRFRKSLLLLITSGAALAIHFGSWGWSISRTTLLDSLLLVSSVPLLLVAIQALRWLYRRCIHVPAVFASEPNAHTTPSSDGHQEPYVAVPDESTPSESSRAMQSATWFQLICCPLRPNAPTWLEALGALCGFLGVLVLLLSTPLAAESPTSTAVATVAGNLAALLGAAAIIPYLEVGASCRQFMPLFIYAFPVTFVAAVTLAVASLAFEPTTTVSSVGPTALLGFLGDPGRAGYALGAAAVSGIAGHTLMNLAVKYVSPLVVGVAVLWEPLLGSILGYIANVQGPPDVLSLVATPLLLGGALLVTLGGPGGPWSLSSCRRSSHRLMQ